MLHTDTHLSICIKGKLIDLHTPLVMAIINMTPDSFYAQSQITESNKLSQVIRKAISDGAHILDIGAYSSRPNAVDISEKEEINRLDKALSICRKDYPETCISIDTFRSSVAEFAIKEYQVDIINDISGGTLDNNMFDTIAKWNVPYVLTHIQGTPQTMQQNPSYEHFIPELLYYFSEKLDALKQRGVADIILDPGFGFGKTLEQNYALIAHFEVFHQLKLPILVGVSRKSMIQKVLNTTAEESLNGTTALHSLLLHKGAHIVRAHDVKQATEVIALTEKIKTIHYDF
jgi:dihydropteroate synthase